MAEQDPLLKQLDSIGAQPTAAPAKQNKLLAAAQQAWNSIKREPTNNPVYAAAKEFAALPSEGIGALFGVPERLSVANFANVKNNPRGVGEVATLPGLAGPIGQALIALDPKGREQLKAQLYSAFHPNDESVEKAAMHNYGVDKLMTTDPRFRGKVQNFAVKTGFETLIDPTTLGTAGTVAAGEGLLKLIQGGIDKGLVSNNAGTRNFWRTFATNVQERTEGRTAQEQSAINVSRNKGITDERYAENSDRKLMHKYEKQINGGNIPPEIRARLPQELQAPHVDISQIEKPDGLRQWLEEQMQTRRTADRIQTTRSELAGHLGGVKEDVSYAYRPGGVNPQVKPAVPFIPPVKKPTPHVLGYETGEQKIPPQMEAAQAQHAQPGVGAPHAAPEPGPKYTQKEINQMAEDRSKGGVAYEGFGPMRAASRVQQEAMTSIGIPHMKNVAVAAYNALGEMGLAKAGLRSLGKIPDHLIERLKKGATASFGAEPQSWLVRHAMPAFVRRNLSHALDKFDTAVRATDLERIDREYPHFTEAQKLDMVNDDIGAYNKTPQFVRWQRGFLAANFPQWHNYIVPTTFFRAAVKYPGRIARYGRYEQNANDTFLPNSPYRITLGGPNDEAMSMGADPARLLTGKSPQKRFPTYIGGPSSSGPVLSGVAKTMLYGPGEIGPLGASFVPGGSQLIDLLNLYKSPLSVGPREGLGAIGAYAQKRPPESIQRTATPTKSPLGNPPPTSKSAEQDPLLRQLDQIGGASPPP